jgi:uncharacterized protein (DUF1330 family)
MTIIEQSGAYFIVKEGKSIGIFDPAIQMIIKLFKSIKEARNEINALGRC